MPNHGEGTETHVSRNDMNAAVSRARWPLFGYFLLIVYGSLYPFIGWHQPPDGAPQGLSHSILSTSCSNRAKV